MTTKDQAIAPTFVADMQGEVIGHLAPDCRTCVNYGECKWYMGTSNGPAVCTNGDQYQPAPKVMLWRTE